ncbi:MAG TPA: response regulator transcription factor [Bacteroidia bacterium]|nr:response regulator transcription factor [Bacteroidia bacterium]
MDAEKIKILLIDDDEFFGILIKKSLEREDFLVDRAKSAKQGYDLFCKLNYDLCLLDVEMPDKDGFTLAQEIKVANENLPIVFITGHKDISKTLLGFDKGADDYITKPFAMEEFVARLKAILRRSVKPKQIDSFTKYNFGNYIFNYSLQTLAYGKDLYRLTTKETELLKLLILNKNKLLKREMALQEIWAETSYFSRRSMDVYIHKLRKYLTHDTKIEILNVHNQGYKLYDRS